MWRQTEIWHKVFVCFILFYFYLPGKNNDFLENCWTVIWISIICDQSISKDKYFVELKTFYKKVEKYWRWHFLFDKGYKNSTMLVWMFPISVRLEFRSPRYIRQNFYQIFYPARSIKIQKTTFSILNSKFKTVLIFFIKLLHSAIEIWYDKTHTSIYILR